MNVEHDFQVHPNRRDHTESIGNQIDALTPDQRWELLHWLAGYAPWAVQTALTSTAERFASLVVT